jgi:hypothetical protein
MVFPSTPTLLFLQIWFNPPTFFYCSLLYQRKNQFSSLSHHKYSADHAIIRNYLDQKTPTAKEEEEEEKEETARFLGF